MKTEKLPDDFIANIDTANEEIQRLAKRLDQAAPDFVGNIYLANEKIQDLEAELAKRKTAPAAAPVTPKPTPTSVTPPARKIAQGTGLMRAVNANIIAQGGTPIVTPKKKDEATDDKSGLTGLQRAMAANVRAAQKKS